MRVDEGEVVGVGANTPSTEFKISCAPKFKFIASCLPNYTFLKQAKFRMLISRKIHFYYCGKVFFCCPLPSSFCSPVVVGVQQMEYNRIKTQHGVHKSMFFVLSEFHFFFFLISRKMHMHSLNWCQYSLFCNCMNFTCRIHFRINSTPFLYHSPYSFCPLCISN